MRFARRPLGRAWIGILVFICSTALFAIERPALRVDSYVINADLTPAKHHIRAVAELKFTALDDISSAVFDLNNGLRIISVIDISGRTLPVERFSQDNAVRISLPQPVAKNSSSALTFSYEGDLYSADDSPVEGLKLGYIGDDAIYLLYPGRWFPVNNYGINRFAAEINIAVPPGYTVVGSGRQSRGAFANLQLKESFSNLAEAAAQAASSEPEGAPVLKRGAKTRSARRRGSPASEPTLNAPGKTIFSFNWEKASFPGSIIAGKFQESSDTANGANIHVYFDAAHKQFAPQYAQTAVKEFQFFSGLYGPAVSATLNVVQLPDDTVPFAWAPEIAAVATRAITAKVDYRLLANCIAHQWWGVSISPASTEDVWLRDGAARYSEARYVESAAGEAGYQEAMKDIDVGALAYDNIPLASVGKLDPFSPQAQSLATEKGATIMSMLRWVIGDPAFMKTMRQFGFLYAGKPASVDDLKKLAEQNYGQPLNWFFTQWLDSTGAPAFTDKYTVYRLGNGKGFRVSGEIKQDLDLFRMPVELRIDTNGKPETKRIEVTGTDSPYSVETYGEPRKITVDPNDRVLKNSPNLKVRVAILRGEQLVQQGDLAGALTQLQKALDINKNSSLAHYRIAEVFFQQHNFQAAADAYREALNGDGDPHWTEVWSHVQLGKIFDMTDQRQRAINEYRQAIETTDNTSGALDEARKYLTAPYRAAAKNTVG